jgi:hypothetical protein
MVRGGVSQHGLPCCRLVWRVTDWVGMEQSVLVWLGAKRTVLVWCSAVVDVLIVGRYITSDDYAIMGLNDITN